MSGLARAFAATGDDATRQKILALCAAMPKPSRQVLRGLSATGVYLGQSRVRPDRCASVRARSAGACSSGPCYGRCASFSSGEGAQPPGNGGSPAPQISYTWDESYTLPENSFSRTNRSGDPRYLALAKRFLQDDTYFNPLAEGRNVLPGQHAYSHVNALSSASQAYLVLGSEKHLRAARNGFGFVVDTQSFATGGWGPDETFRAPGSGEMGASLNNTHSSFETPCGSYGHFKITRYLMRITGDSRYGDSMEKVLYNTILGAKPMKPGGWTFYYSDYNNSGSKFYYEQQWPCCSGTFPQITADYGISSYFHSPAAVYVNLFVPSRVTWRRNGGQIVLEQETQYPYSPDVTLRLQIIGRRCSLSSCASRHGRDRERRLLSMAAHFPQRCVRDLRRDSPRVEERRSHRISH